MDDLYEVKAIRWHTPEIYELFTERNDIPFAPGDSMAIFAGDGSQSRPYSIASGIDDPVLRFIVRKMPDGVISTYLINLKPGDTVRMSTPFGWFRPGLSSAGAPFAFVATGTGIAPFLSYLRSYGEIPPAHCLFGVRHHQDAIELDFLQEHCELKLAVSRENINECHHGWVTDLLPSLQFTNDTHFYLCGLDAMIDKVSEWLEDKGIDFTQIHREVFFYAP